MDTIFRDGHKHEHFMLRQETQEHESWNTKPLSLDDLEQDNIIYDHKK